jgi:hypothetical protein
MAHVRKTMLTVFDSVRIAASTERRMSHKHYVADEATERNTPGRPGSVCWRLKVRGHPDEATDEARRAWDAGDHRRALNLLQGWRPTLAARQELYRELGLTIRTLWAPRLPLPSAQQVDLHALRLHESSGFEVCVLAPEDREHLESTEPLPDLVVHPDRGVVYLLHHTPAGRPDGATRLRDREWATAVAAQLDHLAANAMSIGLFAPSHR